MDRRGFLKYFGIGTAITPVAGGAVGKLLAVPEIEIVQPPAFPNGHVGELFMDRLKWNPYEAIWLYMWQIENNPSPAINYGIGPLEHILGRVPSEAEKAAVAGMMQWFGSNCGHSFIAEALKACGYTVSYEDTKQAQGIRDLQHANIWLKGTPPQVTICHRGRKIELKHGESGRVVEDRR